MFEICVKHPWLPFNATEWQKKESSLTLLAININKYVLQIIIVIYIIKSLINCNICVILRSKQHLKHYMYEISHLIFFLKSVGISN